MARFIATSWTRTRAGQCRTCSPPWRPFPPAVETEALTKIFFVGGVEKSRQYLATHPNAIGIFYQPGDKPQTFKRTVLRSKSFQIPPDSIAELEK